MDFSTFSRGTNSSKCTSTTEKTKRDSSSYIASHSIGSCTEQSSKPNRVQEMFKKLKPPKATQDPTSINVHEIEDEDSNKDTSGYLWWTELPDVLTTILILRRAQGVKYAMKSQEKLIEVQIKGGLQQQEYDDLQKELNLPLQMLQYHIQDWVKTVTIKLEHPITTEVKEVLKNDHLVVYKFHISTGQKIFDI